MPKSATNTLQLNQVNLTNKEHEMITEPTLNKLKAIEIHLRNMALATNGDEIKNASQAIELLADNLFDCIEELEAEV